MQYIFVPPGGFQGFAEQSIAVKALVSSSVKPSRRRARTRKKPIRRKTPRVRRKRPIVKRRVRTPVRGRKKRMSTKRPARMVKGSAAAKRHMAKLRKMRRR